MESYPIHTIHSAPEQSKAALQNLKETFGLIPNLAAAMSESPLLLNSFVGVFRQVHASRFTKAQTQTLLFTNAVTNGSAWPAAFHSALALKAGVAPADVQAIRERRAPKEPKLAALSALTRALIEKRGHFDERDLSLFREADFGHDQLLDVITVIAASAMANSASNLLKPPVDAPFQAQVWNANAASSGK